MFYWFSWLSLRAFFFFPFFFPFLFFPCSIPAFFSCLLLFLVTCTRLYKPFCWVRWSHFLMFWDIVRHFQMTSECFYSVLRWFKTSLRQFFSKISSAEISLSQIQVNQSWCRLVQTILKYFFLYFEMTSLRQLWKLWKLCELCK